MIAFTNVTKSYDGQKALEDVNFKIEPGEFVSIVGKSGAGKSTIIKLLIGEERPTKGRVIVGPHEVNKLRSDEMPQLRRKVGIVFQDFRLLPTKTVYENVAFALEVQGRVQEEIEELVPQMLDLVGLADKRDSFPHELSGGMKQRVAIARAMIHRPAVIIADEPTGNLDHVNAQEIMNLLFKINELGTTVILATHNRDIVNRIKKRVLALENGKLVKDAVMSEYSFS